MIRHIAHKGLREFWESGSKRGIKPEHADRLRVLLSLLDNAKALDDIDVPGLDLHQWKGMKSPPWSISISGSWRLLFQWGEDGYAYDIDLWQGHRGRGRR
jgi:proteic killer suppression protein